MGVADGVGVSASGLAGSLGVGSVGVAVSTGAMVEPGPDDADGVDVPWALPQPAMSRAAVAASGRRRRGIPGALTRDRVTVGG